MQWKVPYSGISNRLGLEEAEALIKVLQQDSLNKGPTAAEFERLFAERSASNTPWQHPPVPQLCFFLDKSSISSRAMR